VQSRQIAGCAQAGQGRIEDRLPVFRGAGDLSDGEHEIEDLVEVKVAGDLACVLGGGEQHPPVRISIGVAATSSWAKAAAVRNGQRLAEVPR
jgi:hypothetical protein